MNGEDAKRVVHKVGLSEKGQRADVLMHSRGAHGLVAGAHCSQGGDPHCGFDGDQGMVVLVH